MIGMKAGLIYKVVNNLTEKVYIGATTDTMLKRKLDHVERANRGESGKLQEAISTYGAGTFSWEQIDTASSVDELAQLEKQYVSEYDSKKNGYNGDGGGGFKKTIYQYNLENGSLVSTFNTLTDAGNAVNATKQSISKACLSVNKYYAGFYWSYELKVPFQTDKDKRKKSVVQYDLNGNFLVKYDSIVKSSISTGINKSSIAKASRGEREHAGGFYWRLFEEF